LSLDGYNLLVVVNYEPMAAVNALLLRGLAMAIGTAELAVGRRYRHRRNRWLGLVTVIAVAAVLAQLVQPPPGVASPLIHRLGWSQAAPAHDRVTGQLARRVQLPVLAGPAARLRSEAPGAQARQADRAAGFGPAFSAGGGVTPAIRALAKRLKTPQRIFSWVRSNIVSVPLWGVIQGAQGCLQTRQCDAHDTALLLAALLGARSVKTRFATGVVQLSVSQLKAAMGGFTNTDGAVDLLAQSGIPAAEVVNSANKLTGFQVEEIWVEARLSPGAGKPASWVDLDGFLKPLRWLPAVGLAKVTGLNAAALKKLSVGAGLSASIPAVTSVRLAKVQAAAKRWVSKAKSKAAALTRQHAKISSLLGGVVAAVPASSSLAGPEGKVLSVTSRSAAIPAGMVQTVNLTVGSRLSVTLPVASLATNRLTIGYVPATSADWKKVHAAGGLYKVVPHLVNLKPVIYLNGAVKGVGPPVVMGDQEPVTVTFTEPSGATAPEQHVITAGAFAAVGVSTGTIVGGDLAARQPAVSHTDFQLRHKDSVNFDSVIGEILNDQALEYYSMLDSYNAVLAAQAGARIINRPREMLMSLAPTISYSGGLGTKITGAGSTMDLRRQIVSVGPRDGSTSTLIATILALGDGSSELEGRIFPVSEHTPAISTVQLLNDALVSKIPLALINQKDAVSTSEKLKLPAADQSDIESDALSGNVVLATFKPVTSGKWKGAAWASLNPASGSFAFIIAGGLDGGGTTGSSSWITSLISGVNSTAAAGAELKLLGAASGAIGRAAGPFGYALDVVSALANAGSVLVRTNGNLLAGTTAFAATLGVNLIGSGLSSLAMLGAIAASSTVVGAPGAIVGFVVVEAGIVVGGNILTNQIDDYLATHTITPHK
jgi:Transglutaminase-like superfamily